MSAIILSIDIGLTNCKLVAFDQYGVMLARATVPYETVYPTPGLVEQDPEDWWQSVVNAAQEIALCAPDVLACLSAISITGHMHALVCVDNTGHALLPALVLGDQRSIDEAQVITDELSLDKIYALTGARMDAAMPLAKLRWLQIHAPEIHNRIHKVLSCKDFIRHRLTGDWFTDPVDACGTSLYDIQERRWGQELLAAGGIGVDQVPDVRDPCEVAGYVTREAADTLGIRTGVPVVVGAGDDVEVLGNGLTEPGMALEHLGTTGSILACADGPAYDMRMALELYPHVISDRWVVGGSISAAGSALAWAERTLAHEPDGDSSSSGLHATSRLDHPLVFVPHLAGERSPAWEPYARGSWIGLSLEHTPADLHQAVLEGTAFALRSLLDHMEEIVGHQTQVTVSGRELANPSWLALRANIYRRPLAVLRSSEPTALGAMIVASVGVGIYENIPTAVRAVCQTQSIVTPVPAQVEAYELLYRRYLAAAASAREVARCWQQLSD